MSRFQVSGFPSLPAVLFFLLTLTLPPATSPALAQQDVSATHTACDALGCVRKPEGCTWTWVSLPAGQPALPQQSAEEISEAIPDVVSVKKEFPRGPEFCDSYTWDAVAQTCTGNGEPGCMVPEPGAEQCESECFCVGPGEGVEVRRSSTRPFNVFGEDRPFDLELQPGRRYIVAIPWSWDGMSPGQLYNSFPPGTITVIHSLYCTGQLGSYAGPNGMNTIGDLHAGEAYEVVTVENTEKEIRAHLTPGTTHIRQGCGGTAYAIIGTGDGSGYSWAVDADYSRPYTELEEAELEHGNAPGAGPGASALDVARALARDISDQGSGTILAQVDRKHDGEGICLVGGPEHPVLWINAAGIPPAEGCDVNDDGPCDIEGASIEMQPFLPPVLWLDKDLVHWTDSADWYDVVYGSLGNLLQTGGDFVGSTMGCLAGDTRELEADHSWLVPDEQDGFWFLARGLNANVAGGYDDGADPGLVESRDEEIAASGADCP